MHGSKEAKTQFCIWICAPQGLYYFVLFDSKISDAYWETERSWSCWIVVLAEIVATVYSAVSGPAEETEDKH